MTVNKKLEYRGRLEELKFLEANGKKLVNELGFEEYVNMRTKKLLADILAEKNRSKTVKKVVVNE